MLNTFPINGQSIIPRAAYDVITTVTAPTPIVDEWEVNRFDLITATDGGTGRLE